MPRAGLDADVVTEAGAALADEVGLDRMSMGLLADRLGVKTPSLYKHVGGLADLTHRIAILAATEVGDALHDASEGLTGRDALAAVAQALRAYVTSHPGRYQATVGARPIGSDNQFGSAAERVLHLLAAVLTSYGLDSEDNIHALRMVRSALHGYATLEAGDGFQMTTDVDESFTWMIDFVDRGLRTSVGPVDRPRR